MDGGGERRLEGWVLRFGKTSEETAEINQKLKF